MASCRHSPCIREQHFAESTTGRRTWAAAWLYRRRRRAYGVSNGTNDAVKRLDGAGSGMTTAKRRAVVADVVSAPVSSTPSTTVQALARDWYGIEATIRRLSSERDENFHLTGADGREYLLKLCNAAEDRQVTEFQTLALLHVTAADPTLPVPHLVPARTGEVAPIIAAGDEPGRVMRLLTYLRGEPLHSAARSAAQCRSVGHMLGRLDLALRDYCHPGDGHELRWDLSHAATLRPLLELVAEPDRRSLAERFLGQFERHALPVLGTLRRQVIHNDFQPSNVLVSTADPATVTGIIDFGDMVRAPLVNDVAVAAAYHVGTAPAPLDYVAELAGAYHRVNALVPEEVDLLFDLTATRLVLTALITNWRVTLHPQNRAYILRNAPAAWLGLERFATIERSAAQRLLRRACFGE